MEKPVISIDELSEKEFSIFKDKHLDQENLSEDALKEIIKIFEIGDPKTGRLCCDDYHPHSYRCNLYYHPIVAVVDRLITEIRIYQYRLSEMERLNKRK